MTRLEALERVAEAARDYVDTAVLNNSNDPPGGWTALYRALTALGKFPLPPPLPSTLPASPAGETVEVSINLWFDPEHREWAPVMTVDDDRTGEGEGWQQIATITARVPLPVIPTISATVETER